MATADAEPPIIAHHIDCGGERHRAASPLRFDVSRHEEDALYDLKGPFGILLHSASRVQLEADLRKELARMFADYAQADPGVLASDARKVRLDMRERFGLDDANDEKGEEPMTDEPPTAEQFAKMDAIADRLLASLPEKARERLARTRITDHPGQIGDVNLYGTDGVDWRKDGGWCWDVTLEILVEADDFHVEGRVCAYAMAASTEDASFKTILGSELDGLPKFFADIAAKALTGVYRAECEERMKEEPHWNKGEEDERT